MRFHDIVTLSRAMQPVLRLAQSAAQTSASVLIVGEQGTGKEHLARAIHAESPRQAAPFVANSCAGLPDTLLESDLFGHEKGAFIGATTCRRGAFEAARGGTLFLDEVGDVSSRLQLDLLRVLEEHTCCHLGGVEPVDVGVRVISATNRDLKNDVHAGAFREELFYRLAVIPITLPPLRERTDDLPTLVTTLLERLRVELNRPIDGLSRAAMTCLLRYPFPGNIRELRYILERAMATSSGPVLQPSDLGFPDEQVLCADDSLASVERQHIARLLQQSGGNISQAARALQIDRVTLYNKIRKYHLDVNRDHEATHPAASALD